MSGWMLRLTESRPTSSEGRCRATISGRPGEGSGSVDPCVAYQSGSIQSSATHSVAVTAGASALLDNVTTVLLIAPVTFLVCDRLGLRPVPFLIAEVLAFDLDLVAEAQPRDRVGVPVV